MWLGYTWGPALLYAKGGYAWLDTTFKASAQIVDGANSPAAVSTASHDAMLDGWTVGGGMEYMLSSNWTIKVEYLHFEYNSLHFPGSNMNVDTAKLGFNYLLGRNDALLE